MRQTPYLINIFSKPIVSQVPLSVSRVMLVWVVVLPRANPASTFPPPMGRARWLTPAATVKLASGISYELRVATLGEPR